MTSFRLSPGPGRSIILANAISFISELPDSKDWRITIERVRKTRSDEQNRYYWGCIIKTLSDATGYESEDVHEFVCGSFFGWIEKSVPKTPNFPSGVCVKPRRTTTRDDHGKPSTLSTIAFSELVEFCQRFAASKGIYIPDPETTWPQN